MRAPKTLDNRAQGRVIDELRPAIRAHSRLAIISAYFTIYAYEALRRELAKIDELRFIFTEPSYIKNEQELQREFYIARTRRELGGSEFEIKLRNKLTQSAVARECAQWLREKVAIRAYREQNMAPLRMVCVENHDSEQDIAIQGTLDFSSDGLGLTTSSRNDNSICLYGREFTQGLINTFEATWNNAALVEDVTDEVLAQMEQLYRENPPAFLYYITLYHIFHDYLGELSEDGIMKSRTGIKETAIWQKLYKFQQDGVLGAIDKIEKYGGCIIADSVGLGKTFTALAIIKYYELRNDRVLVLAPKKLRENWTIYTQNDKRNPFEGDRFGYDVLNHTDLTRTSGKSGDIELATLNWGNYDLVVIDESHNFRNNAPVEGHITRYQKLMEDIIKSGIRTRVLMLSATPVNNRMNDIKNQIAFITGGQNDALKKVGIASIEGTLRRAQLIFNRWSELDESERTTRRFVDMMELDYFRLLDTLTIARSRKHIEKYYDLNEIGRFPLRLKPINRYPGIDTLGDFPPIGEVNKMIRRLTLAIYSPLTYVRPEKRALYERRYDKRVNNGKGKFRQSDREKQLIGLIRVNLLKRMESSIHSFYLTVGKIAARIEYALELIARRGADYDPELNILELDLDSETVDIDDLALGSKVKVLLQDMDLIRLESDLRADLTELKNIGSLAREVSAERDEKLRTLKEIMVQKFAHPLNGDNKKLIIFTAFADTARYLYENITPVLAERGIYTAMVTGAGDNKATIPIPRKYRSDIRLTDLNTVLTLFSPRSKGGHEIFPEMADEIDVLIATDCISEGQNLQDCDYLINYDIHWNPVRIIQRFGRIDRIGSRNDSIQLLNFWPTKDLDDYIDLAERVKGRMVLLDVSATGEENIIDESKTSARDMNDLEYRKKQLQRLQSEVVDLEDIAGGISITDLTYSDFKADLMRGLEAGREGLERAPLGLYAIARIAESLAGSVAPGVIFTLRARKSTRASREDNPLYPYYLIYVTEAGEVAYGYTEAKKILDILKKCAGSAESVERDLVDAFNAETSDGENMAHYSDLLQQALDSLVTQREELGVASLFSRGTTSFAAGTSDDYELVSFILLK